MKWKIALIVAIVAGAVGGSWIKNLPGFVIIALEKTSYEMRLWVAVVILLILITSLYFIGKFFRGLLSGASKVKGWRGGRKWRTAKKQTTKGMMSFIEEQWSQSESSMVTAAKSSDTQLINYLVAAQSAQYQNATDRRDRYLQLAYQTEPNAKVAIGITQAQLQQENNQYEQALATLNELNGSYANHPVIVRLLYSAYEELKDWRAIVELLPQMKKLKIVSAERLDQIEYSSISQYLEKHVADTDLLDQSAEANKLESLKNAWLGLPSASLKKTSNILSYAERLVAFKQMDEAEKLLRPLFKKEPDEKLIHLYGKLNSSAVDKQFSVLENWYDKNNNAPNIIFSALGETAFNASLWGKARFYFERSLRINPSAESYLMMAKTLQKMNDDELSDETYRKGLEFVCQPQAPD